MKFNPQILHLIVFGILSANVRYNVAQGVCSPTADPDTLPKLVQGFEDIKKQLNGIEVQLANLQVSFNEKLASASNGCSVRDITDSVKGLKFKMADEQLLELGDNKKVSQIVHNVYASSPANVEIILKFAKELTDSDAKFGVFAALRDEMHADGHSDPLRLIDLAETVKRELTRQPKATEDIKAKAQSVIDKTIDDVKATSVNILKTAMITDQYQKNVEIANLATAIFNFRNDVSNEVIESVVDSVFGVVAARKILDNISSHKHIPQVIAGLTAVFNRFNFAGNLNNDATFDLAAHLQKLQQRPDYKSMDQELRNQVDGIIEKLPTCAKNLYFHTNICFWNKGKREYLYAASSATSYDTERRYIFTWYAGTIVTGTMWTVERTGDHYFFKNHHHVDEYLYSVNWANYSKDMHYVFTWMPGHNKDEQSEWKIELDGDYCYVKSAFSNEYLFATSTKYNEFNSFVFTWVGKTIVRGPEYQWQLRNCGQEDD